jgi:hypothetical protein
MSFFTKNVLKLNSINGKSVIERLFRIKFLTNSSFRHFLFKIFFIHILCHILCEREGLRVSPNRGSNISKLRAHKNAILEQQN